VNKQSQLNALDDYSTDIQLLNEQLNAGDITMYQYRLIREPIDTNIWVIKRKMELNQELLDKIATIQKQIEDNKPPRVSMGDQEDISDNYQANLEYGWWVNEANDEIAALELRRSKL
jgi:hypothetical protein